jgi:hypothetical protein
MPTHLPPGAEAKITRKTMFNPFRIYVRWDWGENTPITAEDGWIDLGRLPMYLTMRPMGLSILSFRVE